MGRILPYVDAHPEARGGFTEQTAAYALEVQCPQPLLDKALLYQKTPPFVKGFYLEYCTDFFVCCVHFDHFQQTAVFLPVLQGHFQDCYFFGKR